MRWRRAPRYLLLTLGYASLIQGSYLLALAVRFEGDVPDRFWAGYLQAALPFTALSLLGYLAAGLYYGLWRYASTVTLWQVFKGVSLSAMALAVVGLYSPHALFPNSIVVLVWLWQLVLLGGARFSWRLARDRVLQPTSLRARRTLVVGSGSQGVNLVQDMRRGQSGEEQLRPVGYIDDNPRLTGHMIEGLKVRGTLADLPRVIQDQRAEMVIIAQPDLPAKVVREIARCCGEAGVRVKTLPGLSDLKEGRTALSQVRDVRIEDLLGRRPVNISVEEMAEFLRGERVMVTGAGGSIGSELSRQIAEFAPAQLLLLDHAENGLYYTVTELQATYPRLNVVPLVADIQDSGGLDALFDRHRPTVLFHAAAHKHVPLLEVNAREAVLNNVMGTRHLLQASDRAGVRKFVLLSTDKAVNPSSVMGASKRVCEMMMQSLSRHSRTRFVAVRFGNVLGSEGSVLPLFHRQLDRGGPLTVTHPEARRYFMTVHEAVRLVIQAGAMGQGGEVFLLDMGEQVRIVDLARQLIRLAGRDDVEIRYTGLRPGEKLFEELHYESERTRMTQHERIFICDLEARGYTALLSEVLDLEAVARGGDAERIRASLHRLVPEYRQIHEVPAVPNLNDKLVELPAAIARATMGPSSESISPEKGRGVPRRLLAGRRPGAGGRKGAQPGPKVYHPMIGDSDAARRVLSSIQRVAPTDAPVLVVGENGTGKELAAHAIHEASRRRGPFVAVHCAAIPEDQLESELFGHEPGSSSDAYGSPAGQLEVANGGTLFLDEIGGLPAPLQVKLLRVLQDHVVERAGGREPLRLDVRVVAASSRDLGEAVQAGGFREDLFRRMSAFTIQMPGLRERGNDVRLLADYFLDYYARHYERKVKGFTEATLRALHAHPWPGNVGELENRIQRAVILAQDAYLCPRDLGLGESEPEAPRTLQEARDGVERRLVLDALARHAGNVTRAARDIKVSRPTFHDLLRKHAINPSRFRHPGTARPNAGNVEETERSAGSGS